jgi:uncharacterized protein (DUF2147 family)
MSAAKPKARRQLISVRVTVAALWPWMGITPAMASPVNGTWIVKDLVLHLFDCQQLVCGKIVWIKDAARRPAQCGRTIVWGLRATGPDEWTEGSITDPNNETTYELSARFVADGTLHARIFKGVPLFGRTEILRRVDIKSLSGRC